MAIILIKDNQKIYKSLSGVVTQGEKDFADRIDMDLEKGLSDLEKSWIASGVITKVGIKKDALKVWYQTGQFLNRIANKYKLRGTDDELYFWQSVYGHVSPMVQKNPPPQKNKGKTRNHFRLCAKMAERDWEEVQQVGNWSVWRDLFDNSKLMEDERVFDWVVDAIKALKLGHKELRPFIHATRKRLTNLDTSILSKQELWTKLDEVKPTAKLVG